MYLAPNRAAHSIGSAQVHTRRKEKKREEHKRAEHRLRPPSSTPFSYEDNNSTPGSQIDGLTGPGPVECVCVCVGGGGAGVEEVRQWEFEYE